MNHYELPVGAFLAVLLALLPLPWHWKARNVATLSLIAWLVVVNLCRGVNSIIWLDNVRIHAHWWCDISTKLFIGISTALPASSFCITRNLEHIASTRVAVTTAADKRRRRNIDLCITVGFPVLTMILHYVVQGHRFDIVDYVGCQPAIYVSIPALFILYIPPLVLSVGSLTFASLALRHFLIRRVEFERHLRDSQSALTTSRYMRLMALAVCEIFWGTTLGAYVVFLNISVDGLRPWTSWADVHYNFSRIAVYPRYLIGSWQKQNLFLSWWITPATALLFFIFFGFSEEALEGYAAALRWVRRVVFRQTITQTTSGSGTYGASFGKNTMPRFTPSRKKEDSFAGPDDLCLDFSQFKMDLESAPMSPPDYTAASLDAEPASSTTLRPPQDLEHTFPALDDASIRPTSLSHSFDISLSPSRSPSPHGSVNAHNVHVSVERETV